MITLESYVCDSWHEGGGDAATLVNPATEAPLARASTGGLDLRGALAHARDVGGPALRAMSFAERGAMLKALSKALHEAREGLIDASIANAGTTRGDAKFDIDGAIGTLAYYATLGQTLGERKILADGDGEQLARSPRFFGHHVRVPRRGVAVHVNAFNFPAWGLAEKAAVALLAGVPVVSKPATSTALLAYRCMQRMVESGALPRGALQLVAGGAGDLLTHLESQDMLAFTGGGSTAKIMRTLDGVVSRSVRLNVEADSLNAAVLAPSASPDTETYSLFLRDVAREITQKTGQKCTAIRRIFVPRALLERVSEELGATVAAIVHGDPSRDEVRMGPLATSAQLRDVRAGVDRLLGAGAKVVAGGLDAKAPLVEIAGKGYFAGATLLSADAATARAVHEHEVFGPVATVMAYDDLEQCAAYVRLGDGGLVSAVYGDERAELEALVYGIASHHGRVIIGSKKVADQSISPGTALPSSVHGGPGRAGGGEELGGLRGLDFYTQRVSLQGDRALLERLLGAG